MISEFSISQSNIDRIVEYSNMSPNEECGIIIGKILEKCVEARDILHDAIKADKSPFSSIRYTSGIYAEYQKRINLNPDIDYVGEWHSHTKGEAYPSFLDRRAMSHLLNHPKYGFPKQLILGIISLEENFRVFFFEVGNRNFRELKVIINK